MAENQQTEQVLAPLRNQGEMLLADASKFKIESQPDADEVNNALIRVTAGLRELENKRKERTVPINESLRLINGDFKRVAAPFEQAKRILTQKLMDYRAEQRRKDQEAEEAARRIEEGRKKAQETRAAKGMETKPVEELAPVVRPATFETRDTTKTRKQLIYKVVAFTKVPPEFRFDDLSKIQQRMNIVENEDGTTAAAISVWPTNLPGVFLFVNGENIKNAAMEIPGIDVTKREVPVFG